MFLDFYVAALCNLGFTICGSYIRAGLATPALYDLIICVKGSGDHGRAGDINVPGTIGSHTQVGHGNSYNSQSGKMAKLFASTVLQTVKANVASKLHGAALYFVFYHCEAFICSNRWLEKKENIVQFKLKYIGMKSNICNKFNLFCSCCEKESCKGPVEKCLLYNFLK